MVATSSFTPSVSKRRGTTIEPATVGPDARGVGSLRHPPPGPHLSPASRVLSPRPDRAGRVPDRGAPRVLRHRGLREQVSLPRVRRPGAGGGGESPHAHRPGARYLRGRPLLRRPLRNSGRDERAARPQPRRGVGRPLRGAGIVGLRGLRLYLREQGRGDRRDAPPPARPDLRLPLYPPTPREGARGCPGVPFAQRRPLPALRPP